ncbi:MAG: hypothetical protein IT368_02665 [Candidatus Hydrogenedentes bacterium]|nr:hypothetical protein [Candidatus Hydrogenedentota bacterium]
MKALVTSALFVTLGWCGSAAADSIVIDGQTYDDVLIVESPNMYYVKMPTSGNVMTVRHGDVSPTDVVYTEDRDKKAELEAAWAASREGRDSKAAPEALTALPQAADAGESADAAAAEAPKDPAALVAELEANPEKALQDLKAIQSQLPPALQKIDLGNIQNLNMNSPEVQEALTAVMQDIPGTKKAIVTALSQHYGFSEEQTRQILNDVLQKRGLTQYSMGGF